MRSLGVLTALAVRWYVASEGLTGDPAPLLFWVWTGLTGAAVAVLAFGWPSARWWRRIASVVSIPLCLLCAVLLLNIWVGYVRTVEAAWYFVTGGPPPNQADLATVKAMAGNGIVPHEGRIVPVTIRLGGVGFQAPRRTGLSATGVVQIRSATPVAGRDADRRSVRHQHRLAVGGKRAKVADAFAMAHGGNAPVLVFVDSRRRVYQGH